MQLFQRKFSAGLELSSGFSFMRGGGVNLPREKFSIGEFSDGITFHWGRRDSQVFFQMELSTKTFLGRLSAIMELSGRNFGN